MGAKQPGSPMPDVKLAAANCARVVLDAYAIVLQYAHNEYTAFKSNSRSDTRRRNDL
jgi:hypothetical protein